MSMPQGYDFGTLYGMADHSAAKPLEPGLYDAVVESAEWGRTKDGTKGAWTIKFRVTTGERANSPLTMTMSVNPVKTDGTPNDKGMGIMFRQLHAMGIPVGPPVGHPGETPFWAMGWTEPNVAQSLVGKVVLLRVSSDDSYDGSPRAKVADIREPRPGAPAQVQQVQQQQPAAMPPGYGQGNAYAQQAMQNGFSPAQQPNYGQPTQPGYLPTQPGGYAPQQPQGPTAPGAWQNAQPQTTPPQQVPGAPAWAQPGVPGQGGLGEFTPQGQSYQPGYQQPQQGQAPQQPQWQDPFAPPQSPNPQQQPGMYQQQQQPQQGYQPQPGQAPPFQPPQNGQAPQGYQQPQQQQPPNQQPQGVPELPPWAQ